MKTYTVLYAEDVPHYGTREFEVADDDIAIERAIDITPEAMSRYTNDPDHNNPQFRRIVHIEGPEGVIAEGLYLDEQDRITVAAPALADALAKAYVLLDRIRDVCEYEDGLPVTFLQARDIEIIHGDAITELPAIRDALIAAGRAP